MRFEVGFDTARIVVPGVPDRRLSFYGHVRFGRVTFFASRWRSSDVVGRTTGGVLWAGSLMTWYCGRYVTKGGA